MLYGAARSHPVVPGLSKKQLVQKIAGPKISHLNRPVPPFLARVDGLLADSGSRSRRDGTKLGLGPPQVGLSGMAV